MQPFPTQFGLAGLLLSGLLAGAMLVAMGLLRLGGLIEFVPYPVTNGFTAGIAEVGGPLPEGVAVYEISGPLFFGAAQKAMANLQVVGERTRAVILLMSQVHAMDATGLVAVESAVENLTRRGCVAILSGVRPQPMSVLRTAGLDGREGVVLRPSVGTALEAATSFVEHPRAS